MRVTTLLLFLATLACTPNGVSTRNDEPRNDVTGTNPSAAPVRRLFEGKATPWPLPPGTLLSSARSPGDAGQPLTLTARRVHVSVSSQFAHTTWELTFRNSAPHPEEVRYEFSLPEGATISRLALQVDTRLEEGELLGRAQAGAIYGEVVASERDPATLTQKVDGRYLLRVFPVEPQKSRKVVLSYVQLLPTFDGKLALRVAAGLGSGPYDWASSSASEDAFTTTVELRDSGGLLGASVSSSPPAHAELTKDGAQLRLRGQAALTREFSLQFALGSSQAVRHQQAAAPGTLPERAPAADAYRYEAISSTTPRDTAPPQIPTVFILDRSLGLLRGSVGAERALVHAALDQLDLGQEFAVLSCDAVCDHFPSSGLINKSAVSIREVASFLETSLVRQGAADPTNALLEARKHRPEGAVQVVYLGRGRASAGALSASHSLRELGKSWTANLDLRMVGFGNEVNELWMRQVADSAQGFYESSYPYLASSGGLESWAQSLRQPLTRPALPESLGDSTSELATSSARVPKGRELWAFRRSRMAEVSRDGKAAKGSVANATPSAEPKSAFETTPLLPWLWAHQKLTSLELTNVADRLAVASEAHLLSPETALLVLENEAAYRRYQVARTQGKARAKAPVLANEAPRTWQGATEAPGLGLAGVLEVFGGVGSGRLGGAHSAPSPRVHFGRVEVQGALARDVAQRLIRQHFGRFRLCYEPALKSNAGTRGELEARLSVSPQGQVRDVVHVSDTLGSEGFQRCVLDALFGISLPPTKGSVELVVNLKFEPVPVEFVHAPEGEQWRTEEGENFRSLREQLREQGESPHVTGAYVRALLASAQVPTALTMARSFVTRSPEEPEAWETLAGALALAGRSEEAVAALAELVERRPFEASLQVRVARAYHNLGEDGRADAHRRAALSLAGELPALWTGDRSDKLSDRSPPLFYGALPPVPLFAPPIGVEAELECNAPGDACPYLAIVSSLGSVVTPFSPGVLPTSRHHVSEAAGPSGFVRGPLVYRTVLVGGRPGTRVSAVVRYQGKEVRRDAIANGQLVTISRSEPQAGLR